MATCRKCSLTFLPTPKSFTTLQEKKAKQIKSSQTSSSLSGLTTSSPSLCSDFRGVMGLTLWLDAWRFAANRTKLFFYSKLSNLAWLPYTHAMKWPKHGLASYSDSQSFKSRFLPTVNCRSSPLYCPNNRGKLLQIRPSQGNPFGWALKARWDWKWT